MQFSIALGLIISFGSLLVSILIESGWKIGAVLGFFNEAALLTIFGGITGVIIVAFPVEHLKEIPITLKKAFLKYTEIDLVQICLKLREFSQASRQEGILSLESKLSEVEDEWMRLGVQLVVDGLDRDLVKAILESRLDEYSERTKIGSKIFVQLGGFAPTLGIIGTVMGLVNMLANMEDANKLGGAIAVAFLATFWGILTANLIFLPIANRVKVKDEELINARAAMIEGILSLQAGEPVRVLEERLKVLMTHEDAKRFTQALSDGSRPALEVADEKGIV